MLPDPVTEQRNRSSPCCSSTLFTSAQKEKAENDN